MAAVWFVVYKTETICKHCSVGGCSPAELVYQNVEPVFSRNPHVDWQTGDILCDEIIVLLSLPLISHSRSEGPSEQIRWKTRRVLCG